MKCPPAFHDYGFFFLSLGAFAVSSADQQGSAEAEKALSASPMMQVEGFFMALTSSNTDGRVVVHRQGNLFLKQNSKLREVLIKIRGVINFKKKMLWSFSVQALCLRAASSSCCWIQRSTLPRCWGSAEQSLSQVEPCSLWVILDTPEMKKKDTLCCLCLRILKDVLCRFQTSNRSCCFLLE